MCIAYNMAYKAWIQYSNITSTGQPVSGYTNYIMILENVQQFRIYKFQSNKIECKT